MAFFSSKLLVLLNTVSVIAAAPSNKPFHYSHDQTKPAAFFLAGDSTTAVQSTGGGGWGNGFLNWTLKAPAWGRNYGHNGATTVSFQQGGDWATVLSQVAKYNESNEVFVTIQFGHNDQKATANISLSEYSANLAQFTKDVKALGGTPILVTPLTRRTFSGNLPRVVENLSNERNATILVAKSTHTRCIDLNRASTDYVNAIGRDASWVYNLNPTDYTHLNYWGSVVFGRLVSDLMVEKYEDIAEWTKPNATLSHLLEQGLPA